MSGPATPASKTKRSCTSSLAGSTPAFLLLLFTYWYFIATKFASKSFLSVSSMQQQHALCSSVFMCVFQVQKDPIPHVVIDVRDKQVAQQHPLPTQLGKVVAIPGTSVSLVNCQHVLLHTKTGVALMRSQSNTACTTNNAVMVNTCTKWCTIPWGGTHAGLCWRQ